MDAPADPLDLATARRLATHAFALANGRGLPSISVVVLDAFGGIRLAMRSDVQGAFGIETARGKARSALGFRMSTKKLNGVFAAKPAVVAGIDAAVGGGFVPIAGAVPLADASGQLVGAAALSGGTPDDDDAIVREAARHAGLHPLD